MKIRKISLLLYSILCSQMGLASDQIMESNEILSTIWINGLDQHAEILLVNESDQYYVECQVIESFKIKIDLLERYSKNDHFCLVSKSPLQAEFDASTQAIKLQIPANFFVNDDPDTFFVKPQKASLGAFLNYDLFYVKNQGSNDFNALAELGVFKNNWILNNSMLYKRDTKAESDQNAVTRLNTSLDVDLSDSLTRLTVGDTTSISNALMSSFRFGGLSLGTNYTDRPDFIYWNIPALKGSAVLPSTVDLYINGVSIFQQNVTPGDYNLQVGANIEKAGQAQIVVEDILGNRTVQSFPVLISNRLLKKDLNEYNISLGKIRYNYETKPDDYRDFFTNLYFRRGIGAQTTLGVNVSYTKDLQNLGLMWTQGVGTYFILDMVALASRTDTQKGYSAGVALSHNFGRFNLGLSSKYASSDYKILGYDDGFTVPKLENLVYLGLNDLPIVRNFYVNYAEQLHHKNNISSQDRRILTAGFSRQINSNISIGAGYSKEFGNQNDSSAFFTLTYDFGRSRKVYFDYSTDGNTGLNYAQTSLGQVGLDYTFGVERNNGQMVYDLYGLMKTNVGDLTVQHVEFDPLSQTQLNYRGAMVWLDGNLNFTKSVDNAFALVRVGDYADVDVYRSLQPVGKTNKKGYVFVHDIIPYVNYEIGFDENQLPIDSKIPYSNKKISTLAQRGYVIEFPVYQAQNVVIRLLDTSQRLFPAGTEVHLNNPEQDIYPVGSDGLVTLYGLLPGKQQLTIYTTGGNSCKSELNIAERPSEQQQTQVLNLLCK